MSGEACGQRGDFIEVTFAFPCEWYVGVARWMWLGRIFQDEWAEERVVLEQNKLVSSAKWLGCKMEGQEREEKSEDFSRGWTIRGLGYHGREAGSFPEDWCFLQSVCLGLPVAEWPTCLLEWGFPYLLKNLRGQKSTFKFPRCSKVLTFDKLCFKDAVLIRF